MTIAWPHGLLLVLIILHVGINLALHAQPRKDSYSFWYALVRAVFIVTILWWGGFFSGEGS